MTDVAPAKQNWFVRFLSANWFSILLAALAIVFIAQNRSELEITLFWVTLRAPLWVALAAVFVAGWLVAWTSGRRRSRAATRALKG